MSLLASYPINNQGRDFAVGDIHGHFSALKDGLRAIDFRPDRGDRLFSVGDLVDRGPESERALIWLAQPWFHAIRGNHEAMTCNTIQGVTGAEDAHACHGGGWLQALDDQTAWAMHEALSQLPLAIEVTTAPGLVGLVHADLPYDDWSAFKRAAQSGTLSQADESTCLWSIERHTRRYAAPVQNLHALVHGHITVPSMQVLGNVHFIDTHHSLRPAGEQGHFTFLELGTLTEHHGPGGTWGRSPARSR